MNVQQTLIQQLDSQIHLSNLTKNYIKIILKEFGKSSKTSASHIGIPRGLSISAYLAELYMQNVDQFFKHHPHCSYYARYVDDIVIIFHPPVFSKVPLYLDDLSEQLKKLQLRVNKDKTDCYKLTESTQQSFCFEFLGYSFKLETTNKTEILYIDISDKKFQRYQTKIERCFIHYHRHKSQYPIKSVQLLYDRIKFLTYSFHLKNNKRNVLTGFYFTNKFISTPNRNSKLQQLDNQLKQHIYQSNIPQIPYSSMVSGSFSFIKSIQNTGYMYLPNKKRLKELTKIWDDL